MIKIEHTVTASPEQMEFIIEGMRNPFNSWDKSDSGYECLNKSMGVCAADCDVNDVNDTCEEGWLEYRVGDNDHKLMQKLARAGTDHRKYMRMMPVYVRITAPLYWWKEYDTYKVGTVANSCSTMHKIADKEFTIDDFSCEHLNLSDLSLSGLHCTIVDLNEYRTDYKKTGDKRYWWMMIQTLPSSYNQTRNVLLNYEVLANIYKSRKKHPLDEWREFCKWIETLDYSELITVDWKEEE